MESEKDVVRYLQTNKTQAWAQEAQTSEPELYF
jgi:hypothetical protein